MSHALTCRSILSALFAGFLCTVNTFHAALADIKCGEAVSDGRAAPTELSDQWGKLCQRVERVTLELEKAAGEISNQAGSAPQLQSNPKLFEKLLTEMARVNDEKTGVSSKLQALAQRQITWTQIQPDLLVVAEKIQKVHEQLIALQSIVSPDVFWLKGNLADALLGQKEIYSDLAKLPEPSTDEDRQRVSEVATGLSKLRNAVRRVERDLIASMPPKSADAARTRNNPPEKPAGSSLLSPSDWIALIGLILGVPGALVATIEFYKRRSRYRSSRPVEGMESAVDVDRES